MTGTDNLLTQKRNGAAVGRAVHLAQKKTDVELGSLSYVRRGVAGTQRRFECLEKDGRRSDLGRGTLSKRKEAARKV